ncbi:hypothetical protein G9A89_005617 [Geosiphon pyriformis]|nr:hypothetical protein G9A89_005617 [Geosiphon pyriformis]
MLSVLDSDRFSEVRDSLLKVWSDCIEMYMDRFLRCAGSVEAVDGAAAYFLAANVDIRVKITGLLSSTLAELQAVVLVLKCVLFSCLIEKLQIVNLLKNKNISIKWVKIKGHSDMLGNIRADTLANEATSSSLSLPVNIWERFLVAEKTAIFGNKIDWDATVMVWHPDLHMLSGFTIRKRLYSRSYPGVLCLLCGKIEFSDHVFACSGNSGLCGDILVKAAEKWMSMSGFTSSFPFAILLSLSLCSSDVGLYTAVCKGFVMKNWYVKAVSVFEGRKKATQTLVEFIRFVTIKTKHRMEIEKTGLVGDNGIVSGLFSNVISTLSAGVVCMLGVIESFAVKFNRYKLCHFFSGLGSNAFVAIGV